MAVPGEIVRAAVSYIIQGSSQPQNVFHWELDSTVQDDDLLADVLAWVDNDWGNVWDNIGNGFTEITDVKVDVVSLAGTVVRAIGVGFLAHEGNAIGTQLPAGVTPMIFAPTAAPKVRGRKFIPGATESDVSAGLWDAGLLADLALLLAVYILPFVGNNGATLQPGVVSNSLSAFVPFLSEGSFDDIPDYQRRRRPDRGS